jgi:arginase
MPEVILVKNRSEIGAGTRGSSLAVDAIRMASVKMQEHSFFHLPSVVVKNKNEWIEKDCSTPHAIYIERVLEVYKNIVNAITPILEENKFPLIISGDHSNAGGTIAAIRKAHPDKRIGLVWIDAHADLHSPFTTPSGNIHGMALAISLAEDNLENAINNPNSETLKYWHDLKLAGGVEPEILPEDMVFVGLRSFEAPEAAIIKKDKLKNYSMMDFVNRGVPAIANEILDRLSDADLIYVSFDVDVMDLEISQGTGTPVSHGLSQYQVIELIKILVACPKTIAFEVVEVNPLLDLKGNVMAEIALETLVEVMNIVEKR